MGTWTQDSRHALRVFLRSPGWTFVVVLSLALGIGANSAIFSLVNAVLLNPLPFRDPGRLMMIWEDASFVGFPQNTPAPANYADWKSQSKSFETIAAVADQTFTLTGVGDPIRLSALSVTADFFPMVGVEPQLGRFFSAEEDAPGADQVVVLSNTAWRTFFASDRGIIGRDLLLNNKPRTVIGVLPAGFQFLDPEIEFWVPMAFTSEDLQSRRAHYLQVVGRLKDGVTPQQAHAEMKLIMKRIAEQNPDATGNGKLGVSLVPFREQILGNVGRQLVLLLLAVAFVLLIACANIANLLLSKAVSRRKELAIRAALGAGKSRLIRQMLAESLLLSLTGGIVGLILAFLSFSFLEKLVPTGLLLSANLSIDAAVLIYTLVVSVLTGVLFGLAPAWHASSAEIHEMLKATGSRAGAGAGKQFRSVMVVLETALAVVLLVGAGLLIQTVYRLQALDTGFNSENVLRLETRLPRAEYNTLEKRAQFYEQVLERVEAFPGVVSAGYSTAVPLEWKGGTSGYSWEGRPPSPGDEMLDANHRQVSQRLLQTLEIMLVEGRYFDGTETETSQPVAIVNEAMAATYAPNESVLGRRFRLDDDSPVFTVIGVVRNIRNMGLEVAPKAEMYIPMRQAKFSYTFFAPKELLIRTKSDPEKIVGDMRKLIRAVDPKLPVSHIMTLRDVRAAEISHRRVTMILLASFAGLALLLASLGVYGVLSYFVNQHIPEFGVRLALGATPLSLLLLIIRRGMLLVVVGVAIGAISSYAATGVLESVLYGISARDVPTIGTGAAILILTALAACLVPGRRAMRLDPVDALRYE